jgi:hypothetical protein
VKERFLLGEMKIVCDHRPEKNVNIPSNLRFFKRSPPDHQKFEIVISSERSGTGRGKRQSKMTVSGRILLSLGLDWRQRSKSIQSSVIAPQFSQIRKHSTDFGWISPGISKVRDNQIRISFWFLDSPRNNFDNQYRAMFPFLMPSPQC